MFDHTLVIAADDPHLDFFKKMNEIGYEGMTGGVPHERGAICDLRIVPGVGCEMFAKICYDAMASLLNAYKLDDSSRYPVGMSVRLKSAEVFEHAGNSAIYEG
jgi:6-pyruvoyltetrahydropterin/6-carboxytetrahydropterin synthase